MFAHNQVSLIGNLGGDPEIRHFESGKVKARFSLAVHAGKDRPSEWFDVEAWNQTAKRVGQMLAKGSRVALSGSLKLERWQTDAGQNRSKVVVNAENIEVISKEKFQSPTEQSYESF
ncbi:MAG: single-stranded DNA-binding protein [Cyanobacteria bacterium J06576_12]